MAAHDLTPTIVRFLDNHLVFPLLEYLSQRELYDAAEIEAAKLKLIEKTNMVDYAVDIYQTLNNTDEVGTRHAGRWRRAPSVPALLGRHALQARPWGRRWGRVEGGGAARPWQRLLHARPWQQLQASGRACSRRAAGVCHPWAVARSPGPGNKPPRRPGPSSKQRR